jgi:hypothetical protein
VGSTHTRLTGKGVKQDAYFLCETQEEAKEKYNELLDIVNHHDGIYLGKKAKRKIRRNSSRALHNEH